MKYLKTYEELTNGRLAARGDYADRAKLDILIDKIKNKFESDLKKEFSKYLTPKIISIGGKETKAYLLEPDYGIIITIDFTVMPYKTIANFIIVYNDRGGWRRSTATKFVKEIEKFQMKNFVSDYVEVLKVKCERREERKFKRDIKKYNL